MSCVQPVHTQTLLDSPSLIQCTSCTQSWLPLLQLKHFSEGFILSECTMSLHYIHYTPAPTEEPILLSFSILFPDTQMTRLDLWEPDTDRLSFHTLHIASQGSAVAIFLTSNQRTPIQHQVTSASSILMSAVCFRLNLFQDKNVVGLTTFLKHWSWEWDS